MTWNDHDHRGEYAEAGHSHFGEYAEERHWHHDLEHADETAQQEIRGLREDVRDLRSQLDDALERIGALEKQTPQARQLQHEADLAAADLADSGYRDDEYGPPIDANQHGLGCQCPYCYDKPEEETQVAVHDPSPEADEGGMSEYRYILPEDYQRGQS